MPTTKPTASLKFVLLSCKFPLNTENNKIRHVQRTLPSVKVRLIELKYSMGKFVDVDLLVLYMGVE